MYSDKVSARGQCWIRCIFKEVCCCEETGQEALSLLTALWLRHFVITNFIRKELIETVDLHSMWKTMVRLRKEKNSG